MAKRSWIDESTNEPLIDDYAQQLETFTQTFADGKVDRAELQAHEERLVALMREIEPQLDDELHEKVTKLLCELTAYDIVQMSFALQEARPKTTFRG